MATDVEKRATMSCFRPLHRGSLVLIAILLLIQASTPSAFARRKRPEREYQEDFAREVGGKTEIKAPDGTRCDILTETHAIEVDFADKWGESIGQSLNYALQFDRRAGIVLILEEKDDYRFYLRVNSIIERYDLPIDVWKIDAYEPRTSGQVLDIEEERSAKPSRP